MTVFAMRYYPEHSYLESKWQNVGVPTGDSIHARPGTFRLHFSAYAAVVVGNLTHLETLTSTFDARVAREARATFVPANAHLAKRYLALFDPPVAVMRKPNTARFSQGREFPHQLMRGHDFSSLESMMLDRWEYQRYEWVAWHPWGFSDE